MDSAISGSHYTIPESIIVITNNAQPIQHIHFAKTHLAKANRQLIIHNLDDVSALEARMSQGLPANEAEATTILHQRIDSIGKNTFDQQIMQAYAGLMLAFQYQISRYPAIIFDHNSVIYGVADLQQAIKHYHLWKAAGLGGQHE